MPQSLVKNFLHVVFSTKGREPWIDPDIEEQLHEYLGGICRQLESSPIKIGGYHDHVHILCLLSKKITIIKFMEEVKAHSSSWIKDQDKRYRSFYWQRGYGAFSVSAENAPRIKSYIANQHLHHQRHAFQDEFRRILVENGAEYDERYIWD